MLPFITGAWAKIIAALAVALAVILAVGRLFAMGKSAGKAEAVDEVRGQTDKVEQKFDAIDNARPNLNNALDKLRKRAGN